MLYLYNCINIICFSFERPNMCKIVFSYKRTLCYIIVDVIIIIL